MKLKNISIFALVAVLVLGACKYEEGPGISLRSKRDRVANEWMFEKLTIGDSDIITSVNSLSKLNYRFVTVLSMYRTGSYSLNTLKEIKDSSGKIKFQTVNEGNASPQANWGDDYQAFLSKLPVAIKNIAWNGKWNFEKRHYKIQLHPELSYDNNNYDEKIDMDWTIVKLKQKELKLKTYDPSTGQLVQATFKPFNKENYWY